MLTHLQLRDFVIVEAAELPFGPGMTALTGETGAGKSIVVDALLLIAGGRGGADVVREGAERTEVTASFAELPPAAAAWLANQSLDPADEVIVRRVIGADGRSRAYVNGQLMPLQQVREFTELLLEIHGQQEFQHLVKRDAQRAMLDEHLRDPQLVQATAAASRAVRSCQREFAAAEAAVANRESRLELLRYQATELRAEVGGVAAIEDLFRERQRLAARGRLCAAAQSALTAVYEADDGSAHDQLAKAAAALRTASDTDPGLAGPAQMLAEATILTQEAANLLRRYLDALDMNPRDQEEIERHAAQLEALARKHRIEPLELPAQLVRTEEELAQLENAATSLEQLDVRLAELKSEFKTLAGRLTLARQKAAKEFEARITQLMQTLGMAGGQFAVRVQAKEPDFGPNGSDEVEFLVSANPGQPLKSLSKVASGGELSRISLAVQVAAAARVPSLCMVFDEVDSGIGGGIAEIVGRQLRELGAHSQVLCVTHLAQVAAQAHTQFKVVKHSKHRTTRTAVNRLSSEDRVDEIARMLGGIHISEQARAHAREMLAGVPAAVAATPAGAAAGLRRKRVKAGPTP